MGNNAVKQLNLISLSNNMVERRINDMSENVFQQLICRVRASRFYAIQIDESTDIVGMGNLLTFVRYECDVEIEENFIFLQTSFKCNCGSYFWHSEQFHNLRHQLVKMHWTQHRRCSCYDGPTQRSGKTNQRRGPAAHSRTLLHSPRGISR